MAEITELHLIGWPTIVSPAQHEEQIHEAQVSLDEAKRLGAQQ